MFDFKWLGSMIASWVERLRAPAQFDFGGYDECFDRTLQIIDA